MINSRCSRYSLFIAIALLVLLGSNNRAESLESDFDRNHREAVAMNPEDVTFTLHLEEGKSQFQMGEIIRLEMRFSSPSPKAYQVSLGDFDRNLRRDQDAFHLDPVDGVTEPFKFNRMAFAGQSASMHEVEAKPRSIHLLLNQRFRFDTPGAYRFYIVSPRVSRIDGQAVSLASNIIEFEIVKADAAWHAKLLAQIVKDLDGKDSVRRQDACRKLRYLDSKEAVAETIRRYGRPDADCSQEYALGLFSTSHREFVMETMEQRLVAPDQPVSAEWMNGLIQLAIIAQFPQAPSPSGNLQVSEEQYLSLHKNLKQKYAARLAQSIDAKIGPAKAISVKTLLDLKWDMSKLPSAATFIADLPLQEQRALLDSQWKDIASEAMLPALRQLAKIIPTEPSDSYYDRRAVTSLAIKRIYELAPAEGRRLILSQIKQPAPQIELSELAMLPDKTLPEMDSIFVEHLEKGGDLFLQSLLIERYASPAIYSRVRDRLEENLGRWACDIQNNFLIYCLRINEAEALDLVRKALAARGETKCFVRMLTSICASHMSPEIEKLAIESLQDPHPEVAANAAKVLGDIGSAEAEEPLWERLQAWHREWEPRAKEFETPSGNNAERDAEKFLGGILLDALGQSNAWLLDGKRLTRMRQFCITSDMHEKVDLFTKNMSGEIALDFSPVEGQWGEASVAHYNVNSRAALEKKLSQFPAGTIFKWHGAGPNSSDKADALFQELQSFLSGRGCKLVK